MRIVFKMADGEENTDKIRGKKGKKHTNIRWKWDDTKTLARLQFELRVKKHVRLFCLAQRSSPMVKLLVKRADMAINRHNNMSRKTCTILVFDLVLKTMHERKPTVDFAM